MSNKLFMTIVRDGREFALTQDEIYKAHSLVVERDRAAAREGYDDAVRLYLGKHKVDNLFPMFWLLNDEGREDFIAYAVEQVESYVDDDCDLDYSVTEAIRDATRHFCERMTA